MFEEKTKSLIAIDPGDYTVAKNNIEFIEFEKKAQLRCILSTHHHSNHNDCTAKFKAERPDLDVIIGIDYFLSIIYVIWFVSRKLWKYTSLFH